MKKMINPSGTRDLNRKTSFKKSKIISEIENTLSSWGYGKISTPTMEYLETFERGLGVDATEPMYKMIGEDSKVLTLRTDMTVPIVRMASSIYKNLDKDLRLSYTNNVFKRIEKYSGNLTELTDCGAELIGISSPEGDIEVLLLAFNALDFLKDQGFMIVLGDVRFLKYICKELGIEEEAFRKLACLIDEKNLPALESYLEDLDLEEEVKEFFMLFPWAFGGIEIIDSFRRYAINEDLSLVLDELEEIYSRMEDLGYGSRLKLDFSRTSVLDYYTSTIFEGFVDGIGRPILSGGRYDSLFEKFDKDQRPAMGFSIKVDYLLTLDIYEEDQDLYVLKYPKGSFKEAYELAKEERKSKNLIMEEADVTELTIEKGDAYA